MQNSSSSLAGLEQTAIELAKLIASGIVGAFLWWLKDRKKLKPEIQVIEATAAKTYAEARHLNGETLKDAYDRIEELYIIGDSQRTQISRLQLSLDKALRNEEFLEEELQWITAVMHAAKVDLKQYGHMRKVARPLSTTESLPGTPKE